MRALVVVVLLLGCGGRKKSAAFPVGASHESRLVEATSSTAVAETGSGSVQSDVAVRHRREDASWQDIVVDTSASAGLTAGAPPPPPPPGASSAGAPEPTQPEKLVVEAWLDMRSDDVGSAVDAIRARVEQGGGRVVSENVTGSGKTATSAALEIRVPPAQASELTTWIGTLGTVTSKRVLASDVSKTLFDQELALKNLALTMERLQKLAAQSGPIEALLRIETEMTRVRGEIEKIKGEQRWLLDRVAHATLTLSITSTAIEEPSYDEVPEVRIYPGPQLAMLTLFDPGMRERTRIGGGAAVRVHRYATFELSVFPRGEGGDSRAVIATFGSALYSSFLRDGRRRWLNPYIGVRIGYGYLSGEGSPLIAGELGVELFKHKYLVVDASLRTVAFVTSNAEAALHGTLGLSVPF